MNILEITKKFSTQKKCLDHLEKVRWNKKPVCPYCGCVGATKVKESIRYHHCGACNKQYSVTVKTIFHDTKLPLQTWFVAIAIITNAKKGVSSLQLARDLKINQKTAWRIGMQIRKSMEDEEQFELMTKTIEIDECYIGGKKRKATKIMILTIIYLMTGITTANLQKEVVGQINKVL
jgi:transposase-like protein